MKSVRINKNYYRITCTVILTIVCVINLGAQPKNNPLVSRIDPPEWWTGFKQGEFELLIQGQNLQGINQVHIKPDGLKLNGIKNCSNPTYLFLELETDSLTKPGEYEIILRGNNKKVSFKYNLNDRKKIRPAGVNNSDVVYLLMPDRFSNGDPSNDIISTYHEKSVNRDSILSRHGGDFKGITGHLDYLKELGVTALWLNPVQENNQPFESYHGYAITDHYKTDRRLGSFEEYETLVNFAHAKGIKIIMDLVFNHTGNEHWLYKNPPSADWFHVFSSFTRTNFRATTLMDPYASDYDRNLMSNGWFDKHMPDLNQQNTHVSNYLIQQAIWWVEKTGLNGLRIDTWAYPDSAFSNNFARRMKLEYPDLALFGEIWEHGPGVQSYFGDKNYGTLPGVIDFQLYYAINEALSKPFGWTEGASRIYYTLAQDYLYTDPFKHLLFLDNHDLTRFAYQTADDLRKFKSGITFLLSMRGIPCIFYGTEIGMKEKASPDARVRIDFPGGWKNDSLNKFMANARNSVEQEIFSHVQKMNLLHRQHSALQNGELKQFVPENGVYCYFRYNNEHSFMMLFNFSEKAQVHDTGRYKEMLLNYKSGTDHVSGKRLNNMQQITLEPYQGMMIELGK